MLRDTRSFRFVLQIVLPVFVTILLFAAAIYLVALPALGKNLRELRRENIRDLTRTAWCLLAEYDQQVRAGEISLPEAQRLAADRLRGLRYGQDGKQYFWISDFRPQLVMHPYRADLERQGEPEGVAPNVANLMREFARVAATDGEAYVDYQWQYHEDPNRIELKLGYIKNYAPWGWIVGTGMYVHDVEARIDAVSRRLQTVLGGILVAFFALSAYIIWQTRRTELARAGATTALRRSEAQYRALVETVSDWVWEIDANGRYTYGSATAERLLGYRPEEIVGRHAFDLMPADEVERVRDLVSDVTSRRGMFDRVENRRLHKDGHEVVMETSGTPILGDGGELVGYRGVDRDITIRKQAEQRLRVLRDAGLVLGAASDLHEGLQKLLEVVLGCDEIDAGGIYLVNEAEGSLDLVAHTGLSAQFVATASHFGPDSLNTQRILRNEYLYYGPADMPDRQDLIVTEGLRTLAALPIHHDGAVIAALQLASRSRSTFSEATRTTAETLASQVGSAVARFKAQQNQAQLEERLHESQKMEAIGRLAGGVAHDFNNLLTAINGYAELLIEAIPPSAPLRADLDEITRATGRAAELTSQLLSFSRKQIIAPRPVCLNEVIAKARRMLTRIIGEDVDLVFAPTPDLWTVRADPGQIEQILVNLAANARDAMPGGGKLTIETANVTHDAEYSHAHPEVRAGEFAMIAVSDNGVGIDEPTRARIFEPFFSTKEMGKGTGLGLATVYGVVGQNGGHINVYSEPGVGTTFKIYLPRVDAVSEPEAARPVPELRRGTETILLAEDEEALRKLATRILEGHGYRVLQADSGQRAIELSRIHDGPINLLLTDVVIPDMNGKVLHAAVASDRPTIRVLFMSGYTNNVIAHHGVLDTGTDFLAKPFTTDQITRKVREVLDA